MNAIKEQANSLKSQATLLEIPVDVKEIVENFVLITYDIPVSEEGNKARTEFASLARRAGAVMHTESVYYMPWTQQANVAALALAEVKKGRVFVWYAKVDTAQALELLLVYDAKVRTWLDEIDERLLKIDEHIALGKTGLARRMIERTIDMMLDMDRIIQGRGAQTLASEMERIKIVLKGVLHRLAGRVLRRDE